MASREGTKMIKSKDPEKMHPNREREARRKALKAIRINRLKRIQNRENRKHIESKDPKLVEYLLNKNKLPGCCHCNADLLIQNSKQARTKPEITEESIQKEVSIATTLKKNNAVNCCFGTTILNGVSYFGAEDMTFQDVEELQQDMIGNGKTCSQGVAVEFWIMILREPRNLIYVNTDTENSTSNDILPNPWVNVFQQGDLLLELNNLTNSLRVSTCCYVGGGVECRYRSSRIIDKILDLGSWIHLSVSSSHEFVRVFMDGNCIETITLENKQRFEKSPIVIGASIGQTSEKNKKRGFTGYIADFVFFNSALTEAEILEDFKHLKRPSSPLPKGTLKDFTINENMSNSLKRLLKEEDFIEKKYADIVRRSAKEFEKEKKRQIMQEKENKYRARKQRQEEINARLQRKNNEKRLELEEDKRMLKLSLLENEQKAEKEVKKSKTLEKSKRQEELRKMIEKQKHESLTKEKYEKEQIREYMQLIEASELKKYEEYLLKKRNEQAKWRKELREQIAEKERYNKLKSRIFNSMSSYDETEFQFSMI